MISVSALLSLWSYFVKIAGIFQPNVTSKIIYFEFSQQRITSSMKRSCNFKVNMCILEKIMKPLSWYWVFFISTLFIYFYNFINRTCSCGFLCKQLFHSEIFRTNFFFILHVCKMKKDLLTRNSSIMHWLLQSKSHSILMTKVQIYLFIHPIHVSFNNVMPSVVAKHLNHFLLFIMI